MSPVWFLLFSCLKLLIVSAGNAKGNQDDCPDSFDCGSLGRIGFPFTTIERQNCGVLAIHGCYDPNQKTVKRVQLNKNKNKNNRAKLFQVTKINAWQFPCSISIIDEEFSKLLQNANCNAFSYNISVPPSSPFGYFNVQNSINTFNCSRNHKLKHTNDFVNYTTCHSFDFYFAPPYSDYQSQRSLMSSCSMVQLPKRQDSELFKDPFAFLTSEITLVFTFSDECVQCFQKKRGLCRPDSKGNFFCDTTRKEPWMSNSAQESRVWSRKLALILGFGVGPWIIVGLILTLRHCKQKYGPGCIQLQSSNTCSDPYPNRDTETDRIFFGVPVFSYKELQEATNNFDPTRKLGDGGFGTVYYGKLRDGREVAIKHLFENNYKRVEQFMNEIEVLTRLRHRNLVSLYGCTSRHGHELLLVYEYIPNGTVARHLHGELSRVGLLTWPIRMQIAIDTAIALAYLHASNIIHRDVKTNNILLDINFSVKVADFGLSRLLPSDVSHVSTAPQGSPGYLDPEYFQCYRLTDKSDVYSFGVVLIELISSLPAVDATRERDEVNLSNLAMKKIQKGKLSELVDSSFGFESDQQVKRVITSVAELAFRCMQGDNGLRPSMDEVLEALKKIASDKNEFEHLEKEGDGGVISSTSTKDVHLPPRASHDSGQVGLLMNNKLSSSPKSLTEKWESDSTTPNASG